MSGKWMGRAAGLITFLAALAIAQLPTAVISGQVKDSSGAAIPGANVTASNRETGFTRTMATGADGRFRLPGMPVGGYNVRAEAPSFRTEVQQGLTLTVAQEAVMNFTLSVGAVQETVTVAAEVPLVETTSGSLGGLVDGARVADLPLNGRNFNDLVLMQTGISVHRPVSTTSSSARGLAFSSNGVSIYSNYIVMDGASLTGLGAAMARA